MLHARRMVQARARFWCGHAVSVCLTFVHLLHAQPSRGEASPVRVHYAEDAAAEWSPCFSHPAVRDAVARGLKREVFVAPHASDVVVLVRPQSEWAAEIRLSDPEGRSLGTRRLVAATCEDLTELVAFTLTVMLDFRSDEVDERREAAALAAEERAEVTPPSTPPQATTPEQPQPASTPARDTSPVPTAAGEGPPAVVLSPAMGAAVDTGLTPAPLFGAYAELAMRGETSPLWGAVRFKGEHMPSVARAEGELDAWRVASSMQGCVARRASVSWRYAACLGLGPDVTWVRATGFAEPRTSVFWGLGVEPTFEAFVPVYGSVAVHVGVGMGVPLVRNDWHVNQERAPIPLFRAAPVRAVGFIGLAFGR
jgi:hypothetical protein